MEIIATVRRDNEKFNDQTHFLRKIDLLVNHGVTMFRFNMGKWESEEFDQLEYDIFTLRKLYGNSIQIILDLPYPGKKARIITKNRSRIAVKEGTILQFASMDSAIQPAMGESVGINVDRIGEKVHISDVLIYGDGDAGLKVTQIIDADHVEVIALNDLTLSHAKSLFFKGSVIFNHSQWNEIMTLIEQIRPDITAFSFLDSASQLDLVRVLKDHYNCRLMPKLETEVAVQNVEEIALHSDLIMIGRGDLGFDLPLWQFAKIQRQLIEQCNRAGTPVYVATDILNSLSHTAYPSRADLMDLDCIQDMGAQGVVLTYSLVRSNQILMAIRIIQEMGR